MGSKHHPEILALICGGIWDPRETHVSAHLAERVPFVFVQPRFQFVPDSAQVARAVAKERRHHLCDVWRPPSWP